MPVVRQVLVAGFGNRQDGRGLAAADALLFAGDADRTAADADLDEIRAGFDQIAEAFGVDDIAGADQDLVAVICCGSSAGCRPAIR